MKKEIHYIPLSQREETILELFRKESLKNGDGDIAPDGLIFMGELCHDDEGNWIRNRGDEVTNWENDFYKVVILTKEQNEPNDYYDIRSASGFIKGKQQRVCNFYKKIGAILYGVRTLSPDCPKDEQFKEINAPYVRINLKKQTAGGKESDNYRSMACKYKELTMEQLSIYGAKLYFNGAGTPGMEILHEMYPDLTYFQTSAEDSPFKKNQWNRWIWFSENNQVVVINGYHPSCRMGKEAYYRSFMVPYLEFLSKRQQ